MKTPVRVDLRRQNSAKAAWKDRSLIKGKRRSFKFIIMLDFSKTANDGTVSMNTLERIARGDRRAVADCSRIHGPLIWAWAKKFTDSTNAAETATLDILADILNSANGFDSAKCSEITYIKQICIRRLISA